MLCIDQLDSARRSPISVEQFIILWVLMYHQYSQHAILVTFNCETGVVASQCLASYLLSGHSTLKQRRFNVDWIDGTQCWNSVDSTLFDVESTWLQRCVPAWLAICSGCAFSCSLFLSVSGIDGDLWLWTFEFLHYLFHFDSAFHITEK